MQLLLLWFYYVVTPLLSYGNLLQLMLVNSRGLATKLLYFSMLTNVPLSTLTLCPRQWQTLSSTMTVTSLQFSLFKPI